MKLFLEVLQWFFLSYFLGLNIGYILLNLASLISLQSYIQGKKLMGLPQPYTALEPPISVLVPAYNEETTIAASLRSMLQLNYPQFEIVVINDGSKDGTLDALINEFSLTLFPETVCSQIPTQAIRGIYRSAQFANLRIIDKENGGKADALNVGINASHYPLFCGVDADTVLQSDSLKRVVYPFLEDRRVVATGGTVRLANGCEVKSGVLTKVGLPTNLMALLQVAEYMRAFLCGRMGWTGIGGLLIISGAFGVFRKSTVVEVGGYRAATIGEDMELIVRMHRILRARKQKYRIIFVPDPVAWTEAPEDIITLKNQRVRWQQGLSESLTSNFGLMFSHNGGVPGWIAFPFMMIFEWLGPLLEVLGYVVFSVMVLTGLITLKTFMLYLFAVIALGMLVSASSLLVEEMYFNTYKQPKHLLMLIFAMIVENLGYRQLNSYWRLIGLIRWASGSKGKWGEMKRKAVWAKT